MRAKEKGRLSYSGSKQIADNVHIPGKEIDNPIFLLKNPVSDMAAVNKNYVIELTQGDIDSERITEGVFNPQVMPVFTGELTTVNTQEEGVKCYIVNTCVTGVYTRVTVSHTGLITGGGTLVVTQIPNLPWGKITKEKPTTLAGYNISDGLSKDGGILTGTLTPLDTPTQSSNLVNKRYVDDNKPTVSAVDPRLIGDIVRRTTSETASYLRCNGGLLSSSTYPNLYSVIGEKYSVPYVGRGLPWRSYFDLQLSINGSFTTWASSTNLITQAKANFTTIVTKNKLTVIGGMQSNTTYRATVYMSNIDANGDASAFSSGASFPTNITGNAILLYNTKAYSFGGRSASATYTNAVRRTTVSTAGVLSSWTLDSYLPISVYDFGVVVTRNRLVMFGGSLTSSSETSNTYSASISATDVIGTWEAGPPLPVALSNFGYCVVGDSIYIVGGRTSTGYSNNIYRGKYGTDGKVIDWQIAANLSQPASHLQLITTKDKLIIFGGYNGAALNTVTSYDITDTFSLTDRVILPNLPFTWYAGSIVVVNNFIYLIGGIVNGSYSRTLYRTSIIGGVSDYSPWYSNTITPTPVGFFKLPDYSTLSQNGLDYFIKAV